MKLNVVCVKWGAWCAPHGARYVNNLYRGVSRGLSREHRFVCFADDATGIDPGIEVRPLPGNLRGWWWRDVYARPSREFLRPPLALPYLLSRSRDVGRGLDDDRLRTWRPIDLRGWYNKLYLFKPGVLEGPTAFFDLDTVILGPIDDLLDFRGDLCVLRDFYRPSDFGSGMMCFRPEAMEGVWEEYVRRGCPVMKRGDQAFIERVHPEAEYFQDRLPGQVVSYKMHCRRRGVPPYARVVCFHGLPRPHEVEDPVLARAFGGEAPLPPNS